MFKLTTTLTHFRFLPSQHNKDMYTVEWYKLEENEDNSESYGVCLNEQELQELTEFIKNNTLNFSNPQSDTCDNENPAIPRCGSNALKSIEANRPHNLILKRKPMMTHKENIVFPCMDIELLNEKGALDHQYTLSFDLAGKIV